jgi:hypothetical protein
VDPTNNYAAVYTNGVLEASFTGTWPAFNTVSSAWSFIGCSLWSGDAYLNASIDELRLYDGRLTPEQIAADYRFGPDALALPVSVISSNAPGGWNLSWPAYAVGFALETSPVLGSSAVWTTMTSLPALNNDLWQITIPATNSTQFYRLRR